MAVVVKDVKSFPKDAPTELLFEKNRDFIAKYGKSEETQYEYTMAEFLRINGVYWSNTALYLMGGFEELEGKPTKTNSLQMTLRPNYGKH